jgi:hypothetical protein
VTPSRVGALLLPFHCPGCSTTIDFSDPAQRDHYKDPRPLRSNHHCPRCGARFHLNTDGQALDGKLSKSGAAPSVVETIAIGADGLVKLERRYVHPGSATEEYLLGCDLLGAT